MTEWVPFGNFEFRVVQDKQQQAVAQTACELEDGYLATILDEAEQTFLRQIVPKTTDLRQLWIGLEFDQWRNIFWQDGRESRLDPLPWATDEPNNFDEAQYCAVFNTGTVESRDGTWADMGCESLRGYICKRNAFTSSSSTS